MNCCLLVVSFLQLKAWPKSSVNWKLAASKAPGLKDCQDDGARFKT